MGLEEARPPGLQRGVRGAAAEPGTAFVPFIGPGLVDIRCEPVERPVGRDNCVSFEGRKLRIPAPAHRRHVIKVRVRVHRYPDGRLAGFHGPRERPDTQSDGSVVPIRPRTVCGRGRTERDRRDPVELWTSPSGQPAPCGTHVAVI
ncbi:MAG: hypothetical protein OXL68_07915, partial [Paracoccaceae bacterium]|nr:hypothetical protein [Paracoccaceae bacterium]